MTFLLGRIVSCTQPLGLNHEYLKAFTSIRSGTSLLHLLLEAVALSLALMFYTYTATTLRSRL